MEITNLNESNYVDIFGGDLAKPSEQQSSQVNFGQNIVDNGLIGSTTETTTLSSTTETTTEAASSSTTETTTLKDVNLFPDDEGEKKAGRKPKYNFDDASGYFADRIKSGKFVAIQEEDTEGKLVDFLPKTPEEFDEVIDIQVNYKIEQQTKDLEQKWYQSKSPAWQLVAKYSELTDDPADIIPFIAGVKQINNVNTIDESTIDGAERIVRMRLEQRGDTPDVIEEQIDVLKTTDKLVSTAQKFKPILIQEDQRKLQALAYQKQEEEKEYVRTINEISEKAVKSIDSPFLGKIKLKQDEKAEIYNLIGSPSQETQGYLIYSAIDQLFDKRDFDTLKEIALLLTKKDAYMNYIRTSASQEVAASLQKKLRVAGDMRIPSGSATEIEDQNDDKVVVQRNKYSSKPAFGRTQ